MAQDQILLLKQSLVVRSPVNLGSSHASNRLDHGGIKKYLVAKNAR